MAHLRGSGNMMIKPENGTNDSVWSDEPDCIPLKKRRKMLLAIKLISNFADFESENELNRASISPVDDVNKEEQHFDSQSSNPVCFAREERLSLEQSHAGMPFEYSCQGTEVKEYINSYGTQVNKVNTYAVLVEKVVASASSLPQSSMPLKYPVKLEVDYADNNLTSSLINGVEGSLGTYVQAVKIKTEIFDDFVDDLDHIVLKERRRLLLSRKPLKLTKPVLEGDCSLSSKPVVETTIQQSVGMRKGDNHSCAAESSVTGDHTHDVSERNASDFCETLESVSLDSIIAGSSCTVPHCSTLMESCQGIESGKSGMFIGIQGSDGICSSKKASTMYELCGGQNYVSGNPHCMRTSVISSTFVNIKAEPLDYSDVHSLDKSAVCNFPSNSMIPVKSELEIPEEIYGDKLDHMLLRDRIKLLASRDPPNLDNSRNFKCLRKIVPSVRDCSPIVSESSKPLRISRPRKRRKTATDSVETALEEDAPGLLQVLIGKGVSVNEIKLYGEMESDEALDESFSEDGFSELEAVISKLFSQRQSLLKLAPIRCTKGEKASYCLACLISLVEQARYLQFRNWPVEWGWCRDLQSFIFVFERHNRIVLERPEYGYATYFFELLDFLPINWQIKRLVTAMKLTSCSRVTLIENKALLEGSLSSELYSESEDSESDSEELTDDDGDGTEGSDSDIDEDSEHASDETNSETGKIQDNVLDDDKGSNGPSLGSKCNQSDDDRKANQKSSSSSPQSSSAQHDNVQRSEDFSNQSDLSSAMQANKSGEILEDNPAETSSEHKLIDNSLSSCIQNSTSTFNEPVPGAQRPSILGCAPAKEKPSMESVDLPYEDEAEIERLENIKIDLQNRIAEEAKVNALLQASLETRKNALHERRLALEQDVARLQEQLQKERELRAGLEDGLKMPQGSLPTSTTIGEKTKAELEEIARVEGGAMNVKQKTDKPEVQLNQQHEHGFVYGSYNQPQQTPNNQVKLKEKEDIETAASLRIPERSTRNKDAQWDKADSDKEMKPDISNKHLPQNQQLDTVHNSKSIGVPPATKSATELVTSRPTNSKKSGTRGEGGNSTSSALSKITSRLNFLKERRYQIANELQNLNKGQSSGPPGKGSESRPSVQNQDKFQSVNNSEKGSGWDNRQHVDIGVATEGRSVENVEQLGKSDGRSLQNLHKGRSEGQSVANLEKGKSESFPNADKGRRSEGRPIVAPRTFSR